MFHNFKGIMSFKSQVRQNKFLSKIYLILHDFKVKNIVNNTVNELISLEQKSPEKINHSQKNNLIQTLSYAYNNCLYYNNLFKENNVDPLNTNTYKNIPFLTKALIRKHQYQIISKEFNIDQLVKKNTGGSTGEPLEFYCTTKAGLIDFGHHWYLYKLMGYQKGDTIVGCGGLTIPITQREKNIYWIKRSKKNVFGEYLFSVLYLTEYNIDFYVQRLIEVKPSILRGYPSFYDRIAQHILKNKIQLNFNVKGVNLTAEMCTNQQRINIEKAFSTMVYFEYGHSEVALYCYTKNDSYIYQSSPIYGFIEVLNEDGSETKVGDVGEIVVTGFINKGMPLIRYKTGDLGELHYKNGGHVKLKRIYGRSQDYIFSKENEKVYLTALIFGQHLKAFSKMKKWQIIQNNIGKITILIIKEDNFSKSDEKDIVIKLSSVTNIDIKFIYVTEISQTKAGKHLFLIQNVKS